MCGFAAVIEPGRQFPNSLLQQFDQDLFHRGPDAGGQVSEDGFALVFRRLSILDPRQDADQPMTDETGRYTLVFNGEIYNYRQLRHDLEAHGIQFKTTGDTEVLLQGLIYWGVDVVKRLEGMFAFVFVDRHEKVAHVARDPFGIKPLYFRQVKQTIGIASEMRPLLRLAPGEPDPKALSELLTFGWAAGTLSNVKGIDRVQPGRILEISLIDGAIKSHRYFDILDTLSHKRNFTQEEAVAEAEEVLEASLKSHLASDVGYTVQLSGGVDSSLLTALAKSQTQGELHTFGIDLGDYEHDEKKWRKQVVERYPVHHHEIAMNGKTFADALPKAVHHMEGPVPHGGCVFLMQLCEEIKKFSKVVLVGEGADEVFGGYERYADAAKMSSREALSRYIPDALMPNTWPFKGIKRLKGRDAAVWASVYADRPIFQKIFPELSPVSGYREQVSGQFSDYRDRLFAVDQTAYLESLLVRQDKMSMAASVESRVPFVHLPLLKLVNSMPHSIRIPGGHTKPLLKKISERYLPYELLYRRKVGLLLPYDKWCKDEKALGRYLHLLTDTDSKLKAYSQGSELSRAVDQFRSGTAQDKNYMFRLINIELWLRDLAATQVL